MNKIITFFNNLLPSLSNAWKGNGLTSQVFRGSIGSISIKLLSTSLGFLSVLVLARVLGAESYGVYAFTIAIISLVAVPAQLGLPQLIIRESAKARALEEWSILKGLWRWSTLAVLLFSLISALAVGIYLYFTNSSSTVYGSMLVYALPLIPLIALGNIRGAALQGLKHVAIGQIPENIIRPSLMVLILLVSWFFYNEVIALDALIAYTASAFLAFIIGAYLLYKKAPKELWEVDKLEYRSKDWILSAIPLALVSSVQLINNQTDIIMLTMFRTADEVGVYKVIYSICTLVIFGFMAIQLVVSPYIASLYIQADIKKLQNIITLASRATLALALPVVIFLIIYGEWLLTFLFGKEYSEGYIGLIILCAGRIINASLGFAVTVANMSGNEKSTLKAVGLSAILNIVLNGILIPLYGVNGAAFATVLTLCTWNFYMWHLVKLKTGINASVF
ncbi:flippase [Cobetia amphilecti]|nr:flippase [Cobetia litoralis]